LEWKKRREAVGSRRFFKRVRVRDLGRRLKGSQNTGSLENQPVLTTNRRNIWLPAAASEAKDRLSSLVLWISW
jgi:hypothetical protein